MTQSQADIDNNNQTIRPLFRYPSSNNGVQSQADELREKLREIISSIGYVSDEEGITHLHGYAIGREKAVDLLEDLFQKAREEAEIDARIDELECLSAFKDSDGSVVITAGNGCQSINERLDELKKAKKEKAV